MPTTFTQVDYDPFDKSQIVRKQGGNIGSRGTVFTEVDYDPFTEPKETGALTDFGRGLAAGGLGIGESAGTVGRWLGERLGSETLTEAGRGVEEYFEEKAQPYQPPPDIAGKNVWDNPELLANASWWAYNIGNMVPSLAATLIPGAGTGKVFQLGGKALKWSLPTIQRLGRIGQMVGGGLTGGALEGSQTYKEVLKQGGTEEEAARAGELMALGSGFLNAIGTGKILEKAGKGFKANIIKRLGAGAWEGITEGLEEPTEVFSKYIGKYLSGEEVPEGIMGELIQSLKEGLTVAPIAAVTGFGAGGVQTEQPTTTIPPTPEAIIQQMKADLASGKATLQDLMDAREHPKFIEMGLDDEINKVIIDEIATGKLKAIKKAVAAEPGEERGRAIQQLIDLTEVVSPLTKDAAESAQIFEQQAEREKQIRQSPEGTRLLKEQLAAESRVPEVTVAETPKVGAEQPVINKSLPVEEAQIKEEPSPTIEKAKEEVPIDTDTLKDITVQVTAIRGETGEEFTIEQNAKEAVESLNSRRNAYSKILECLNA